MQDSVFNIENIFHGRNCFWNRGIMSCLRDKLCNKDQPSLASLLSISFRMDKSAVKFCLNAPLLELNFRKMLINVTFKCILYAKFWSALRGFRGCKCNERFKRWGQISRDWSPCTLWNRISSLGTLCKPITAWIVVADSIHVHSTARRNLLRTLPQQWASGRVMSMMKIAIVPIQASTDDLVGDERELGETIDQTITWQRRTDRMMNVQ